MLVPKMNQEINQETPSTFPAKRKRGRPCKYPGLTEAEKSRIRRNLNLNLNRTPISHTFPPNGTAIGQPVHGVVEATFGDGYLLNVRVGNSETALRGVVFKPKHCIPVTPDKDLVPTVQMIQRHNISIPKRKQKMSSFVNGSVNTNPEFSSALALSPRSEVATGWSVPFALRPPNISNPSVVTKGEASGSSKGCKFPSIKSFGEILNGIIMKRAQKQSPQEQDQTQSQQEQSQTQSQQEQSETQTEDQALSPEPLQALHPADVSSVIKPIAYFGAGKMTELVQDNAKGMHTPPPVAEAAPGPIIFGALIEHN